MTVQVISLQALNTIINSGSGYISGGSSVATTGGSGSGLRVLITSVDGFGAIQAIGNIVGDLSGYVNGDILTIQGGSGTAQIQLTQVNSIAYLIITSIGNGIYSNGDVINISGGDNTSTITLATIFSITSIGNFSL